MQVVLSLTQPEGEGLLVALVKHLAVLQAANVPAQHTQQQTIHNP